MMYGKVDVVNLNMIELISSQWQGNKCLEEINELQGM